MTEETKAADGASSGVSDSTKLLAAANDKELLEVGRKAIEERLIEFRDSRFSELMRGNGLVIREKDGKDSSIIRFGPETALYIGLKAMAEHLAANPTTISGTLKS